MAIEWNIFREVKNFNLFTAKPIKIEPVGSPVARNALGRSDEIVEIPFRYFQYGRFMRLIPFSIERTAEGFKCEPTKGPRRVLLSLVFACCDIWQIVNLVERFRNPAPAEGKEKAGGSHIATFVDQLVDSIWQFYYIAFRYLLWTRGPHFVGLLNSISALEKRMRNELGARPTSVATIRRATIFFVAYPFLEAIWSVLPDTVGMYKNLAAGNYTDNAELTRVYAMTIADKSIAIFTQFADSFALIMVLMNAWVMKTLAAMLIDHLRSRGEVPLTPDEEEKVTDICTDLLEYSEKLEQAIGFFVFTFCFALMPSNSVHVMEAFTKDWYGKILTVMFTITYVVALCTSADANLILKEFSSLLMVAQAESPAWETKEELEEEMFRMEQLRILLHRISGNGFGIKGHAFTITYGFVGNMAGLILTYAIIIIQFQGTST